jgi:hypothetical protein
VNIRPRDKRKNCGCQNCDWNTTGATRGSAHGDIIFCDYTQKGSEVKLECSNRTSKMRYPGESSEQFNDRVTNLRQCSLRANIAILVSALAMFASAINTVLAFIRR